MPTSLGLLALFGLFTIGSAANAQCAGTVDGTAKYCKMGDFIGKCVHTSGLCNLTAATAKVCDTKSEHATCGHDTLRSLMGVCDGTAGQKNCKYTSSVQVDYTIQAIPTKADTIKAKVVANTFKGELDTKLTDYSVQKNVKPCTPEVRTVANGKLVCTTHAGSTCKVVCNEYYSVETKSTRMCNADATAWSGSNGKCTSSCPVPDGAKLDDAGKLEIPVTGGTLECGDVFNDTLCTLSCTGRVKTTSTYNCNVGAGADNKWDGIMGMCGPKIDVSSSVNLMLQHGDVPSAITGLTDKTFNAKFSAAVAAELPSVMPENVVIVGIKALPHAALGTRRLTESSVQVDDPEGATEFDKVEDDGGLPVGGGLRGIR